MAPIISIIDRREIEVVDPIAGAQCGDLGWQRYSRPEPALRHLQCAPGGLAAVGNRPAYTNSIKACPEPAEGPDLIPAKDAFIEVKLQVAPLDACPAKGASEASEEKSAGRSLLLEIPA